MAGDIGIERVQDVTLRTADVPALHAFYARIGFRELITRGDDFVVFAAGTSEFVISGGKSVHGATGIGFLVADVAAIETRLREAGIAYVGPMQLRPGKVGVRVTDPHGNIVEFFRSTV